MELSVLIPIKDEADNILPLLTEITQTLDGLEYEVLFINDGSRDESLAVLESAMHRYPRLRVLSHRQNYGQSTSLLTGARQARGKWIVTLDGDGQNDPADIPRLMHKILELEPWEHWMVCGLRKRRMDSPVRRFSTKVANAVRRAILKDSISDTGCGLKLFPRETFLALPSFDHMHRFLPALVKRLGGLVVGVEVHHRSRSRGISKYGIHNRLWVGIVDMIGVLWLQKRSHLPQVDELLCVNGIKKIPESLVTEQPQELNRKTAVV